MAGEPRTAAASSLTSSVYYVSNKPAVDTVEEVVVSVDGHDDFPHQAHLSVVVLEGSGRCRCASGLHAAVVGRDVAQIGGNPFRPAGGSWGIAGLGWLES